MFKKVQDIGVDHEDHIACKVVDTCIGMCSNIIKKLMTCIWHGFCALSLLGWDSADGRKNGWVNRTSVIEEGAKNILHKFGAFFGEWGGGVHCNCLHSCPELDWGSLVWCMLWIQQSLVLVFEEGLVDVVWHMEIDHSIDVVPS